MARSWSFDRWSTVKIQPQSGTPLQNGACVLDFGPQFLPRRADDSCPVVSFVSPCTLPRTERIMFMKYMFFALKMHSNRSFQFFSSGATCLTTSGIFETVHSTILPFALQEHRRRGRIVTLRSRSSTHAPFWSGVNLIAVRPALK